MEVITIKEIQKVRLGDIVQLSNGEIYIIQARHGLIEPYLAVGINTAFIHSYTSLSGLVACLDIAHIFSSSDYALKIVHINELDQD